MSTDDQPWPPLGPTTTTAVLGSYPYAQYTDDSDVVAFFDSYNEIG